jgi:hypothetical protein
MHLSSKKRRKSKRRRLRNRQSDHARQTDADNESGTSLEDDNDDELRVLIHPCVVKTTKALSEFPSKIVSVPGAVNATCSTHRTCDTPKSVTSVESATLGFPTDSPRNDPDSAPNSGGVRKQSSWTQFKSAGTVDVATRSSSEASANFDHNSSHVNFEQNSPYAGISGLSGEEPHRFAERNTEYAMRELSCDGTRLAAILRMHNEFDQQPKFSLESSDLPPAEVPAEIRQVCEPLHRDEGLYLDGSDGQVEDFESHYQAEGPSEVTDWSIKKLA